MKKASWIVFKSAILSVSVLLQLILFVVAVIGIFGASYILGYHYLLGNSIMGNDTFSFFTVAAWISKTFPAVPFWFPLEGGGVSFTGYPWFAAYLVNVISHTTSFDLVQSFRLLGFLSVPLTGVGIFVYVWARFTEVKPIWLRQILGIIASMFFVIAPVSWIWLERWGFYAEQVSMIFVPWIFLFVDIFIERLFQKKFDFLFRVGFVGTLLFWVLGFITHFFVGLTTILIIFTLVVVRFIFFRENRIALAKRIVVPLLLLYFVFSCLLAFRYYSYSRYGKAVATGGLVSTPGSAPDRNGTALSLLTPKMMLSLETAANNKNLQPRDLIEDMRFPFYVWILVIPSLLLGVFKSKKVFAFSILTVLGFLANTNVDVYIFFSSIPIIRHIPLINQIPLSFLGRLFFVPARVFVPVTAAFGGYVLWELLGSLFVLLGAKLKSVFFVFYSVKTVSVLAFTLLTIGVLVYKYYNLPFDRTSINAGALQSQYMTSSGQKRTNKVSLKDIWGMSFRPDAVESKAYSQEQEDFLQQHPEYADLADYISLDYYCAYDAPGKLRKEGYPMEHFCTYYYKFHNDRSVAFDPNGLGLFPPLASVQSAEQICQQLSRDSYVGDNAYCHAFYTGSVFDQLTFKNWPAFSVSSDISGELHGAQEFLASLPQGSYRFDVSGFAARTLQSLPLVTDNSVIQIYMNNLSLIYNLWNYQTQVMYSVYPLYQTPGVLTEIGKWFGMKYVYLSGTPLEPLQYWQSDSNWKGLSGSSGGWYEFSKATGLTSWDNRPKMLVISDNSRFFYDDSFKFFTQGGMPYNEVMPVMGSKYIDDYSSSQLAQYEMIFMRGYGYHFKWHAYQLLDTYVKNGGKLIFDTGWQYYVPDYEITSAPDFMPFGGLVWKNLDASGKFDITDSSLAPQVDASKFGDLQYGSGSWGVSAPTVLRGWAKPVVSYDGTPLVVVGNYGSGKVVWMGFNLIAHEEAKNSREELKLFHALVSYMDNGFSAKTDYSISERRVSPDRVEFTVNQSVNNSSNLFFREAYYPDWQAKLISSQGTRSVSVQRAGPGFMSLLLPAVQSGDKVVLEIHPSLGQYLADIVSLLTLFGLLIYIVYPGAFAIFGRLGARLVKTPKIHTRLHTHMAKTMRRVNVLGKSEDDDY